MKISIECTPCEVAEMLKSINVDMTSISAKESADNAVVEQNRQRTKENKTPEEIYEEARIRQLQTLLKASEECLDCHPKEEPPSSYTLNELTRAIKSLIATA